MEQLYPVYRSGLPLESIYDDLELPLTRDDRSYVALNMVTSIDGKITLDQSHQMQKIGSLLDRRLMLRLRRHFDGVLRGARTIRANPSPLDLPRELTAMRREAGQTDQPVSIVVSGSLDLPVSSAFFRQEQRIIVLTTTASNPQKREELRHVADVEVVGEDAIDVDEALVRLRRKYGIERLLVEGGASLNYAFIEAQALDSIFWTLAPKVGGFAKDLTMVEGPHLLQPVPTFTLRTLFHHENELFFHWSTNR